MPDQSFHHTVTTPAPIDQVWKALDLPSTWEAIPGVDRVVDPVVDTSGRLRGFSFETAIGGRTFLGQATPAGREELSRVSWDISTSEIKGRLQVGLAPEDRGTTVEVRLDVAGAGFLGSLLFPAIASAIGTSFTAAVEDFVAGL